MVPNSNPHLVVLPARENTHTLTEGSQPITCRRNYGSAVVTAGPEKLQTRASDHPNERRQPPEPFQRSSIKAQVPGDSSPPHAPPHLRCSHERRAPSAGAVNRKLFLFSSLLPF